MIIDFHTHCFPERIYKTAMEKLTHNSSLSPSFDGSLGGLKSSMSAAGIDFSVVCNIATNAKQTENVNNFALSIDGLNDGIISFGSVHPETVDYKSEIKRLKDGGIKGVKFHPDYQEFFVDDPHMVKVFEYCADQGLIILFHAGVDVGLKDIGRATPKLFAKLADMLNYPKIVAAHLGGMGYTEDVFELLVSRNIYIDTSVTAQVIGAEQTRKMIEAFCGRVLFASDAPWTRQSDSLSFIKNLGLSDEMLDKVLYKNAQRLLGFAD